MLGEGGEAEEDRECAMRGIGQTFFLEMARPLAARARSVGLPNVPWEARLLESRPSTSDIHCYACVPVVAARRPPALPSLGPSIFSLLPSAASARPRRSLRLFSVHGNPLVRPRRMLPLLVGRSTLAKAQDLDEPEKTMHSI